jgi:hypothetical protein
VQRGHEDVYWFGWNVPTSSGELFMLLALEFAVGVINSRERDELPSLCGFRMYVCRSVVPPPRDYASPCIVKGEGQVTTETIK